MKKLILAVTVVLMSAGGAFANDELKAVMKEMGSVFKKLGPQISNPELNASSIELMKQLDPLIYKAAGLRPDLIGTLPANAQRASELRYEKLMAQLQVAAVETEQALTANDQAAAMKGLKTIGELRKQGHNEFQE